MECLYPLHLNGSWLPCGHCIPCRIRKVREWTVRLLHEYECWNYKGLFLTLTYSDPFIPTTKNGIATLRKKDLQKYFKRVRKSLSKKGRNIKYFACGEYGQSCVGKYSKNGKIYFKYGRPHFHVIMFGVDYNDIDLLRSEWLLDDNANWRWSIPHYDAIQKKVVSYAVGNIEIDSLRYVVGYTLKKWQGKTNTNPMLLDDCENYFQTCSQGLGLEWLKKNFEKCLCRPIFSLETDNGKRHIGLPLYYKRKLGLDAQGRRNYLIGETNTAYDMFLEGLEQVKEEFLTSDYEEKSEKRKLLWLGGVRGKEFTELLNGVTVSTLNLKNAYTAKDYIYEDYL